MRERGLSFKEVLNLAVRRGLGHEGGALEQFVVENVSLGRPAVDLTKALSLASHFEDEELVRKMAARK